MRGVTNECPHIYNRRYYYYYRFGTFSNPTCVIRRGLSYVLFIVNFFCFLLLLYTHTHTPRYSGVRVCHSYTRECARSVCTACYFFIIIITSYVCYNTLNERRYGVYVTLYATLQLLCIIVVAVVVVVIIIIIGSDRRRRKSIDKRNIITTTPHHNNERIHVFHFTNYVGTKGLHVCFFFFV